MKAKSVPSSWLERDGRRLDCGPYMSGALEALVTIEALKERKDPLSRLTIGHRGGIYNGPQFKRHYVESREHGVPFLTGGDVLNGDVGRLPLLRKKDAYSSKLSYLQLAPGMTLISCSGAIGRMSYARSDMTDVWSSQDVMKVVPDSLKVAPGYVYAFLSSKFGVPLVVGGTYGAIIQHIEPEHIAKLPVPRFGEKFEREVHEKVERAASLRAQSNALLDEAKQQTCRAWGIDPSTTFRSADHPDVRTVMSSTIAKTSRFDAFFYGGAALASDKYLEAIRERIPVKRIGDPDVTKEVFETTRFGRVSVEGQRYGIPFLSITDMMRVDPKAEAFISRRQAKSVRAIVETGWLVLPRVGQLQGVFGTVCFVPSHLDGVAVSDNNIRIVPVGDDEGAYLWAALSSDLLYKQIIRRACGTSIPYLDSKRVADIPVPWPTVEVRHRIAAIVKDAMEMKSAASKSEAEAVFQVEARIGGAN